MEACLADSVPKKVKEGKAPEEVPVLTFSSIDLGFHRLWPEEEDAALPLLPA